MNLNHLFIRTAVPALVAGMAFFFISCGPGILVKEETKTGALILEMHQTAEDRYRAGDYQTALALYNRILAEYPRYEKRAEVQYRIAVCLYETEQYGLSKENALQWVKTYPDHPSKKQIMLLLGEDFEALEDRPNAFYWFLEARKEFFNEPQVYSDIDERLKYLITTSGEEDLSLLTTYSEGTHYAPLVRRRSAIVYLELDDLEKASEIAQSMVNDSQNQDSVLQGMAILEQIREELSVNRGVIGCLLPMSGPFAIYGEEVLNGVQLRIFNSAHTEIAFKLVVRDTKDDPNLAVAGLEDLVRNEKVVAVIGPLASKTAEPVARRAQELGVPIITLTQKQGITEEGDMVFRNFLTPSREVNRVLEAAVSEMGLKRFAILYPDNSYGRFFMNLFWDQIEEMGGSVTVAESYLPDTTDFADQIKKMTGTFYPIPASLRSEIIDTRPPEEEEYKIYSDQPEPFIDFDAVFIPDNSQRVVMIAPQLLYHDVQGVLLMGTSLWQSRQLINLARDYVQGAIFPSGFFDGSDDPEVQAFRADYEENFGTAPGLLAAVGYDTIGLLQTILSQNRVRTRKAVRNELYQAHEFKGLTGNISFDAQGELQNRPFLLTVSGRKMIMIQ